MGSLNRIINLYKGEVTKKQDELIRLKKQKLTNTKKKK